jgi:hypothetical protein
MTPTGTDQRVIITHRHPKHFCKVLSSLLSLFFLHSTLIIGTRCVQQGENCIDHGSMYLHAILNWDINTKEEKKKKKNINTKIRGMVNILPQARKMYTRESSTQERRERSSSPDSRKRERERESRIAGPKKEPRSEQLREGECGMEAEEPDESAEDGGGEDGEDEEVGGEVGAEARNDEEEEAEVRRAKHKLPPMQSTAAPRSHPHDQRPREVGQES